MFSDQGVQGEIQYTNNRGGDTVINVYCYITVSTIIVKYSIVGLNKVRLTYNDCLFSFV